MTKDRRNVFTKPILEELRKIFQSVCKDFSAELAEFEGEKDHVHLLELLAESFCIQACE